MSIVTENRTTQLISIMGHPVCDIAYYMARMLNAIDKRVLVIDNSKHHELFEAIKKPDDERLIQQGELYFTKQMSYSEDFFSQYDFVIIYHGMEFHWEHNRELNTLSDFRYLQTDYRAACTKEIAQHIALNDENLNYRLIFRDKISSKISEKTIITEIGLPERNIIDKTELSYLDQDYLCYLSMLRNGSIQIKAASAEIKDFLKSVLEELFPDQQPKVYAQYFKKAQNSKIK